MFGIVLIQDGIEIKSIEVFSSMQEAKEEAASLNKFHTDSYWVAYKVR